MSKKYFCDACEDELTPDNTFGRSGSFDYTAPITDVQFQFNLTFGSNANGSRIVQGDGDLCNDCVKSALAAYVLPEPDSDDSDDDISNAFAEDEDDDATYDPVSEQAEDDD